jgi:MinD superfamily P-loop ATPase
MQKAFVDLNKCLRCDKCHASRTCPLGAIFRIDKEEPSIVEPKLCHGCGDCMAGCPAEAVILKNN